MTKFIKATSIQSKKLHLISVEKIVGMAPGSVTIETVDGTKEIKETFDCTVIYCETDHPEMRRMFAVETPEELLAQLS